MEHSVGRYRILEQIGRDETGDAFKAVDPLLDRVVRITTIPADFAPGSTEYETRLRKVVSAAHTLATLTHPSIVTLRDSGEHDGRFYLVTDWVEGETMASLLRSGVRFAPEVSIRLRGRSHRRSTMRTARV